MSAPAQGIHSVLRIPGFRKIWAAQFVSVFGDFLAFYAASSFISFRLHGTPSQVTMIMVSFLVPFAVIGPIAGVFVDRWDARRTMIASDLIRAALVLGLIWARAPWQIYLSFALLSTVSTFFVPAQSVVTPMIVPRESLISASAVMQQTVQVIRMVSPAVAGALAGTFGERACYAADSASFVASALFITSVAIPTAYEHQNRQLGSVVAEMNSGLRYVIGHPVIGFVVVAIAAGTFAISAFGSLLAIYVRDILREGPYVYGGTGAMVGAGMLAGALTVAPTVRRMAHPARLIAFGLFGCGLFVALMAGTHQTIPALLECGGVGLAASLILVPAFGLLQSEPEPEMRGRVNSIAIALLAAAQAVAIFFAGDIAARSGIAKVYFASGILLGLMSIAGWFRLRQLT